MAAASAAPSVIRMSGAAALTQLIQPLCALVAPTEFASYKEPQWRFLLGAGDVTVYAVPGEAHGSLFGCVLRVGLGGPDAGYGMMVVSKEARGRGLARVLLEAAMSDGPAGGRRVLGICTPLGQPFYAKLGFKAVSTITGLTGSIASVEAAELTAAECAVVAAASAPSDEAAAEALVALDRSAGGFDRSACIRALLAGGATSATASDAATGRVLGRAALRQDAPGAPLIVGPVIGCTDAVVPLLRALLAAHPRAAGDDDVKVTLMLSGHPDLAARLTTGLGFSPLFATPMPGMTLDGAAVYQAGGGEELEYLGLVHPTLA